MEIAVWAKHYKIIMTTFEQARPNDWHAALELALARMPPDARRERIALCVPMLQTGVLDPGGIWIARRGTAVVGVQVCVPLPGASCLFWLPSGQETDALVAAALHWLRRAGCKIAQAALAPDDLAHAGPLLRHGFQPVTRIHVLRHDLSPSAHEAATDLKYAPYRPALEADFAAILERTYEGTLDCPELNGKRAMDDILAGHRGQGKFHPECWWLASVGDRPIGVVLLTEMPDVLTWELMYVGLIPEARRRGYGRAMTLHALHWLRGMPARELTLSVDARNLPARRLYEGLGFIESECQDVLLRFF